MRPLVAKIAISSAAFSIDKPYDYDVKEDQRAQIAVGMRVMVPFGAGNHRKVGIILSLEEQVETGDQKRKAIEAILDTAPVLDQDGIQVALWMHRRYFCTVYDAIKAMLPAGLWFALEEEYQVQKPPEEAYAAAGDSGIAAHILDFLFDHGGCASFKMIQTEIGNPSLPAVLRKLILQEVLAIQAKSSRRVKDRMVGVLRLAHPAEKALQQAEAKKKKAPAQYSVIQFLSKIPEATFRETQYFTGVATNTLNRMVKSGVLALEYRETFRRPDYGLQREAVPIVFNASQQAAWEKLRALCSQDKADVALLYGITGSGKTMVYVKLLQDILAQGKSGILLVPEIALTPQLLQIMSSYFENRVAVLHSSLRPGERYDEWKRIRSGEARVVIGTRSAIFAPVNNLGLIILDEEQEHTYQSENTPRYHARDVAKFRCARANALLLLGSATPSVESFYHAQQGTYHMVSLPERYNAAILPRVFISDMKEELRRGNGGTIGERLRNELEWNLEQGQQSILYLNRRGNSQMIVCGECGSAPSCPHCSVYLTYHSVNGRLMCHHCGYSEPLPHSCKECGGQYKFIGAGTQKVQEELQTLFPGVEILRMDTDTVSAAGSHQKILERFANKKVPILLGTQMVAKGLDFSSVTLVGVIAADLSLYMDDFRASERTFSLLTQVVGRAGRGALEGRAVIQTYTPQNEVIQCAARQDYDAFYTSEIQLRKLRNCPPFCDLFVLSFAGRNEQKVIEACTFVKRGLQKTITQKEWIPYHLDVMGPAPAHLVKRNDQYRYQITVACVNREPVRRLFAGVYRTFQSDQRWRNVSLSIEINGNI